MQLDGGPAESGWIDFIQQTTVPHALKMERVTVKVVTSMVWRSYFSIKRPNMTCSLQKYATYAQRCGFMKDNTLISYLLLYFCMFWAQDRPQAKHGGGPGPGKGPGPGPGPGSALILCIF